VRRAVRLPLETLQPFLLEVPGAKRRGPDKERPPQPLTWQTVFGNDRPVEIEVGFGKGLFLLSAAQTHPKINFLGVEIERKYQLYTATRIAKRNLVNVRLVCGDARFVLAEAVPPDSVEAVHVYFPDPWWKTRHRKRRLFTVDFVAACSRVLRPGGRLHVATDVEDYFTEIRGLLTQQAELRESSTPLVKDAAYEQDYLTNFERKYRKAGKPIWRAVYEKVTDDRCQAAGRVFESRG
jgi:tRNA (guanine-N7-)-methyltransferase